MDRLIWRALGAAFALAGQAAPAHALLVSYPTFDSTAGLSLVGSATAVSGVLRLTPASPDQAGAAFVSAPVTLGAGMAFAVRFQFRMTNAGGMAPADGITFVLAKAPSGLGSPGSGLGYGGVPDSVALELDTFNNGPTDGNGDNQAGIDVNGATDSVALSTVYGVPTCGFNVTAGCLSNGDLWTVTIDYDGALLTVGLSDPAMAAAFTAFADYPLDIGALLGTDTAFVGLTGSTGAGFEQQDIVDLSVSEGAVVSMSLPVSLPEPGSLALLGPLVAAGRLRRRR